MHEHMRTSGKAVLDAIEKGWDDKIEGDLKQALESFVRAHGNSA